MGAKTNNANSPTWEQRQGHPRLCTARRRGDGKPCGRYAIRGGNVCGSHGGHAPQVRRKAKQRMDFAKDMMLLRAFKGIPEPAPTPTPRRATRPAGPPTQPAPQRPAEPPAEPPESGDVAHITKAQHEAMKRGEPLPAQGAPVAQPRSPVSGARGPRVPTWALPPPAGPTRTLVTEEEALAATAAANRAAGVYQKRRKRR